MRTSHVRFAASLALAVVLATSLAASAQGSSSKLDPLLQKRISLFLGSTRVVVRAVDGVSLSQLAFVVQLAGGSSARLFPFVTAAPPRLRKPGWLLPGQTASSAPASMTPTAPGARKRPAPPSGPTPP